MFKTKEMTHSLLIGTKDVLEPTIEVLHALNCVHIRNFKSNDALIKEGRPLPTAEKQSETLVIIRSLFNYLNIKRAHVESVEKTADIKEIEEKVLATLEKLKANETALREIDEEIKEKKLLLTPFMPLDLDLSCLRGYKNITSFVGLIKKLPDISSVTDEYELFSGDYKKKKVFALFVSKKNADAVEQLLRKNRFERIELPEVSGRPNEILKKLRSKKNEILKI